ncbi:MAG: hypothetical protein KA802_18715 [Saprospiraceae bacterium]|nr:hypothetical protein [Saprospiraceae bacterium]
MKTCKEDRLKLTEDTFYVQANQQLSATGHELTRKEENSNEGCFRSCAKISINKYKSKYILYISLFLFLQNFL